MPPLVRLTLALVIGFTSCTTDSTTQLDQFVGDLEEAGLAVEDLGPGGSNLFEAPGRVIQVESSEVFVYEYASEVERKEVTDTIGMDGWSVNGTPVEWIGTPHYWVEHRLLMLYLGDDATVIAALADVLGEEFEPAHP